MVDCRPFLRSTSTEKGHSMSLWSLGRSTRTFVEGNSKFGLLSLLVLVFGLFPLNAEPIDNPTDEPNEKLLLMMNDVRTKAGIKTLNQDKRIDDAAAMHLAEFVKNGQISDQFEGEPSLQERLRMAKAASGAAAEIVLRLPDLDHVPEVLKRDDIQKFLLNPAYSLAGVAQMQSGGELFIVANLVRPLQSLSADEVEKTTIDSLQQARTSAKRMLFKVIHMRQLRGMACDMAKKDSLKAAPVNPYFGYVGSPSQDVRNFTFTTVDPGALPHGVQIAGDDPKINTASVGVCFAPSKTYPDGIYGLQSFSTLVAPSSGESRTRLNS